jgi:indole-3-glycerol phosphate synthase
MIQIRRRSPNPSINVDTCQYQVKVPDAEPRHILEKIVWHKEVEVERMRETVTLADLHRQLASAPPVRDFILALRHGNTDPAVIAEVKKASPSKGIIREDFEPMAIAQSYQKGGASCISVLTDREFFQGSFDYLQQIRSTVDLPLLCKDFIVYPYQIYLARVRGADAILLIAAILTDKDLKYFLKIAKTLGMAALVEIHTLEEFDRVLAIEDVKLVGINNRNLEDFSVDLNTTCELLAARSQILQEREILVVSESGLHVAADVAQVKAAGAGAVLIGESLMKQPDPGSAISTLFPDTASA